MLALAAEQRDRHFQVGQPHRPEDEGEAVDDRQNRERFQRKTGLPHEKGDDRLNGEGQQRRQRQRRVEVRDGGHRQFRHPLPRARPGEQFRHQPMRHYSARRRLDNHRDRQRERSHVGPGQRRVAERGEPGGRHRDEADHRSVRDAPGLVVADQQPLPEPAVGDRGGPRQQYQQPAVRQARDVVRQREPACDLVEYGRQQDHDLSRRHDPGQPEREAPERTVARPVFDERRRCAHQHDDGRLDDDGKGEGDAERRQVRRRIGQARNDRGEVRPLGRHHQPGAGDRQPEEENGPVGERRLAHAGGVRPRSRRPLRPVSWDILMRISLSP